MICCFYGAFVHEDEFGQLWCPPIIYIQHEVGLVLKDLNEPVHLLQTCSTRENQNDIISFPLRQND